MGPGFGFALQIKKGYFVRIKFLGKGRGDALPGRVERMIRAAEPSQNGSAAFMFSGLFRRGKMADQERVDRNYPNTGPEFQIRRRPFSQRGGEGDQVIMVRSYLSVLVLAVAFFGIADSALADKIFKWRDRSGQLHFTDSETNIPEEYRDAVSETMVMPSDGRSASAPQSQPWTRAPGVLPTILSPEGTLRQVADLLDANNIDELMKSFLPDNRTHHFFRGRTLSADERSLLAAFFRGATLVKSGWWEESHGGVLDEYRLFRGNLQTGAGMESYKIQMVQINECSMTAMGGFHDPGQWIIFGWQEGLGNPDHGFRAVKPMNYRCPPLEGNLDFPGYGR